jgi:uncharacterized membrane protein YfcA/dolichol kinase
MELFWLIVASVGAGVGTGLAGLSAATVMVPILLVLCPSFAGETGAYQATAIALASDVLGSAVTSYTYIKHGNIDLKRGWIMLVCILSMCTVGSFAAWKAGNVVLGSFTLILTFCIGIRFLVKPDTSRKDAAVKGAKLDWKGVIISLFFGLCIGFGAGFVGTGGGMMMLVVFTAFLGMELKTAVGTSTFIMTFTALIASVAHIVIHPAIVLEKWDIMLLCIVVATVSSLVSARFANRVNNRTIGLVTGAVLTVLGGAMLILNYWDKICSIDLLYQVFICYGNLLKYLAPAVCILLLIRHFCSVPDYIFRKLLHLIAFSIVTVMILSSSRWEAACLTSLSFAVIVYPILMLLEKEPWFDKLLVQKKPGEIKTSLLLLFIMIAADIAAAWGIFGKQYIAVVSVLMWGFGDAAAAIIGIRFGKHIVPWKISDGKKTWEGTMGMFLVSALVGCAMLILLSGNSVGYCILAAVLSGAVGALTELASKNGSDTVTVPAVLIVMLLLLKV